MTFHLKNFLLCESSTFASVCGSHPTNNEILVETIIWNKHRALQKLFNFKFSSSKQCLRITCTHTHFSNPFHHSVIFVLTSQWRKFMFMLLKKTLPFNQEEMEETSGRATKEGSLPQDGISTIWWWPGTEQTRQRKSAKNIYTPFSDRNINLCQTIEKTLAAFCRDSEQTSWHNIGTSVENPVSRL